MAPLFERSYTDLVGEMVLDLSSETRITRTSPGSKARSIIEIVSRNLNQAYKIFDLNFARAFLSGATGRYLDFIGEILGISRLGSEIANASSTAQIVKFFVDHGTFGDINNNSVIIIPAGTIISSQGNSSGILYKVTNGVVLPTSGTEQFISVIAITPGESSNVGSETLRFHNFTNYTDTINNSLKVINISGIFNGAETENDTNYKFRISKSALGSESANQTAILLAALSVPGVANIVLQNRSSGIGTFKLIVKAVTSTVSQNLLDQIKANVDLVTAEGIIGTIDRPDQTGMSFTISIIYRNGIGDVEKDAIEEQIRLTITNYVDNLDIGEEFILNQIIDNILSVSPNIKDIGKPNTPIDEIFIYKETKLRDNKIRQELFNNYSPTQTERLIIEPTLSVPIVIIRK